MDDLIDISFIIPCHNLQEYIRPLLYSLYTLNLDNIEGEFLFILDDCTDSTEAMIRNCMAGFNYTIIICRHHSCGLARNEGLDRARGKYIWFLDGDDWIIYPDVLQDVLPTMEKQNLDIIQLKFVSNHFNREYFSMVWQYIYRRETIGDLRFTEIQPNEDVVFNTSFFNINKIDKITKYSIPTYFYNYKRPGSNMSQYSATGKVEP